MSLYFNGDINSYLSFSNVDGLNFGTGDFTIEWWLNITYNNPFPRIFQIGSYNNGVSIGLSIEGGGGSTYLWSQGGANYIGDASFDIWNHYAICRNSGTTTLYRNGVNVYSFSDSADYVSSDALVIGNETDRSQDAAFTGSIVGFSWSKGISRYNTDFTPLLELPAVDSNTQFVLGGLTGSEINGPLANTVVNSGVLLGQTNLPSGYSFVPVEPPVVPVYTFEQPLRRLCCQRLVFGVDDKKTEKKGYTRILTSNYSTLGRRRR